MTILIIALVLLVAGIGTLLAAFPKGERTPRTFARELSSVLLVSGLVGVGSHHLFVATSTAQQADLRKMIEERLADFHKEVRHANAATAIQRALDPPLARWVEDMLDLPFVYRNLTVTATLQTDTARASRCLKLAWDRSFEVSNVSGKDTVYPLVLRITEVKPYCELQSSEYVRIRRENGDVQEWKAGEVSWEELPDGGKQFRVLVPVVRGEKFVVEGRETMGTDLTDRLAVRSQYPVMGASLRLTLLSGLDMNVGPTFFHPALGTPAQDELLIFQKTGNATWEAKVRGGMLPHNSLEVSWYP